MKQQFVPYEIALKLQEKGFDWHCLAVYMNGEFQIPRGFGMAIVTTEHVDILKGKAILAPLWQQAFDWCLRKLEDKNPEPYNRNWCYGLLIDGSCFLDFGHGDYCKDFKTKEEAIEHALTLI